jgi:hypothetical protein
MEKLLSELKEVGLKATLENTGGGVMVCFIEAKDKFIGVDEYSVVVYDSEHNEEKVVFLVDDSSLNDTERQRLLVVNAVCALWDIEGAPCETN